MYACVSTVLNSVGTNLEKWIYANCKTKIRVRTKHKNHTSSKGRMNRRAQRVRLQSRITPLLLAPFVCMTATAAIDQVQRTHFDTDSHIIRVDNCATTSISSHIEDTSLISSLNCVLTLVRIGEIHFLIAFSIFSILGFMYFML